jgi:hypothetical protein
LWPGEEGEVRLMVAVVAVVDIEQEQLLLSTFLQVIP